MRTSIRTILQILSLAALATLCIYLCPRYTNPFKYHFELGQPWGYGLVTAEFDFPIYKTDIQLQQEYDLVMEDYTPCYTLDSTALQTDIYVVSLEELTRIQQSKCKYISILKERVATLVEPMKIYTPKTAYQLIGRELLPNLKYDSITSSNLQKSLISSVSLTQGKIQSGKKIIDTGEIVTDDIYQELISLRHAIEDKNISQRQSLLSIVGSGICIALLIMVFYFYLYTYRRKLLDNLRHILFFVILMAIITTAAFLTLQHAPVGYIYMIPFAWCPIIARVFYDSRTAIFVHLITVFIVSIAVPAPYTFLFMQALTGIIAVISLRDMTQRAQLAKTAAFILITYSVLYTSLTILTSGSIADLEYRYYIYFVINAILVICSYGLIFLFERSFGLLSNITLVELTNVNSNLMLEFAEKAPGTFQHSLQVSNLATEAAKRIGAKVLLVRTGALYHDIGKMSHPDYFIENQTGKNPLDNMSCAEAAHVIINHVEEGERIARKHRLPELIVHFIRSHHGTSITRFFYNTAVNAVIAEGRTAADIRKEDYTYPGPKPSTKEAAILMMADAIEARSRSLTVLTEQSINDMVDQMIDAQVADGQFSETNLSFKDLEDIRAIFKQKLTEMNHHRITYPTIAEK
jgi:putative nucleotidyltransferase with HDIG domain